MEKPTPPRKARQIRRGLFALTLTSAAVSGVLEYSNTSDKPASAENIYPNGHIINRANKIKTDDVFSMKDIVSVKRFEANARLAEQRAAIAKIVVRESTTTTSPHQVSKNSSPPPVTSSVSHAISNTEYSDTNANSAFTPTWYRCVIEPESSDRANITSGLFGILVSTWHSYPYNMSGVPGDYTPDEQARIALEIYRANGGFGPPAWNNTADCGKNG